MNGSNYRQWIHDVTAKRLESKNFWLSEGGGAYIDAVWVGPSEDLAGMPEGEEFFEKQKNKMRRYLTTAADLMVIAAADLGEAEISPECVKRGTRAMIEIKCASPFCNAERMMYPNVDTFGVQVPLPTDVLHV